MPAADLTSRAYRHIHQQLATGKLLAGAVLSEKALATELGISRTPVGEAVRQLASEGLVEQVPRYGTVVKEITRQDVAEIYELREAIEPFAARKAASQISPTQLEQLAVLCQAIHTMAKFIDEGQVAALDGGMLRQFLAADRGFHHLIIRAAGNSRLLKVIENSREISLLFSIRRPRHDASIVHGACQAHDEILNALGRGDGEAAEQAMRNHVCLSKSQSMAYIDAQQDQVIGPASEFPLELSDDVREALERLERDASH